jgi:hypothetical protein
LAGPMTCDSPAKILVSAARQNGHDSMIFSADRVDFEDFYGIYIGIKTYSLLTLKCLTQKYIIYLKLESKFRK